MKVLKKGGLIGSIGPGKRNDIVCVFLDKHFGAIKQN